MPVDSSVVALVLALGVAAVSTGLLMPVLSKYFVDVPNERSSHVVAVPRGGGLGVILGVLVAATALNLSMIGTFWPWAWLALFALLLTGLIDDLRTLGTAPRLAVQVVSGTLVAVPFVDPSTRSMLVALAAVIFVVGLVNAFNFMDGINGISAITILVAGGWFIWLGQWGDVTTEAAAVMSGAALGFLLWNLTGKVFLGDVGSYFLGGLLAVLIIGGIDEGAPVLLMVAPVVLYVADTSGTLIRRAVQGHRVGAAHRDHVYQRLTRDRMPHVAGALVVGACEILVCISAWLLREDPRLVVAAWVAVLGLYASLPTMLPRRLGRSS